MKVHRITTNDVYQRLDVPFNPPILSQAEDERSFFSEWHDVNDRLKNVLSRFGRHDDFGEGDFNLSDHAFLSRGMAVEFTSSAMIKPEVLRAIVQLLSDCEEAYELNIEIAESLGGGNVFVSSSAALTDISDRTLLKIIPPEWQKMNPRANQ